MPRSKRTISQTLEDDLATYPKQENELQNQDQSSRPKRVRKQTQRYSNTSAAAGPSSKAVKKHATNKGKGKNAPNSDQQKPANELPKGKSKPKEEKRRAEFMSECPLKVMERAERVRTQRFFLVDRQREGRELKEEFKVLGSTANVYTVTIDHKPKCNCPDNRMGNHCKHIMFIFLKVLCVSIESHIWYQKALLTNELESVFSGAPEAPNSVTNPRVREAFLRATGQVAEPPTAATNNKRRIPGEEDDCPICYDTMFEVTESALVFCEECGNALHKECFVQYDKSARQTGRAITCVWCRSEWGVTGPAKTTGSATRRGAFINLAGAVSDINV